MPKNVLLLGGAFDPPTIAHATIADKALIAGTEKYGDCELWFLPSYSDAFGIKKFSSVHHRQNMLNLLVHGYIRNPSISISHYEIDLANKAGTYAVVKSLRNDYPGINFVYVIGFDHAIGIRRWRKSRDLLKTIPFMVFARQGFYNHCGTYWFQEEPHTYFSKNVVPDKISSSIVRSAFQDTSKRTLLEGTTHPNLTPEVHDYIIEHDLYKAEEGAVQGFVLGQSTLS